MKRTKALICLLLLFMGGAIQAQVWQTLNVAILGDSNTWSGGDDCSKPNGWNTWFKKALEPASCWSYARSGATWTHTTETRQNTKEVTGLIGNDNVIYNQIRRMEEAVASGKRPSPNLIVIAAGTNDAWFPQHRPDVYEQTAEKAFTVARETLMQRPITELRTLAEVIRYDCELIWERFPQAQIVLLTPIQSTKVPVERITQVGDIIEACAQKMCIGVIRMDREGCINAGRESQKLLYTRDGTHTNEAGARRNGRYIANRIRSLIEY